jgi:hypothetical protein
LGGQLWRLMVSRQIKSAAELARHLQARGDPYSESYVQKWLNGQRVPTKAGVDAISLELRLTVDEKRQLQKTHKYFLAEKAIKKLLRPKAVHQPVLDAVWANLDKLEWMLLPLAWLEASRAKDEDFVAASGSHQRPQPLTQHQLRWFFRSPRDGLPCGSFQRLYQNSDPHDTIRGPLWMLYQTEYRVLLITEFYLFNSLPDPAECEIVLRHWLPGRTVDDTSPPEHADDGVRFNISPKTAIRVRLGGSAPDRRFLHSWSGLFYARNGPRIKEYRLLQVPRSRRYRLGGKGATWFSCGHVIQVTELKDGSGISVSNDDIGQELWREDMSQPSSSGVALG